MGPGYPGLLLYHLIPVYEKETTPEDEVIRKAKN